MHLITRLAEALGVPLAAGEIAEEEAALRRALEAARASWPGVAGRDERFVLHLASHVRQTMAGETTVELRAALEAVALADLFLAFACLEGDAAALAHFSQTILPEVDLAYARFRELPIGVADARQRVLDRLLFRENPALARYSGRGPLRAWVSVLSLRVLLNVQAREAREVPVDPPFFDALGDSGELPLLKDEYREAFSAAFQAAVQTLSNRQRSLLRYAFSDGLNVSQIGKIYRVHRATAARWIAAAREQLVHATYDELLDRLDFTERDLASILRAALSQVNTSIAQHFRAPEAKR